MKLLSFGEIIWDVFPDAAHIGGASLNFAAHAAMQGVDAYVLSGIGHDELGSRAMEEIAALGVNTSLVSACDRPTGQCLVTLDENAVPSYNVLSDTAYDLIEAPAADSLQGFDVLAFGTLALRGEHNRKALAKVISTADFSEIFTDLNIRAPFYSDESISICLGSATIVKISDEELPIVTRAALGKELTVEAAASALCEKFAQIKLVIITKGRDGAYAYDARDGKEYSCPTDGSRAVSTVGAGDSFGATFLSQYFNGKDIPQCLRIASRVSGFVVSREGAVPKYDINDMI